MRILHCIPTLATGGAERQLAWLAPALAAMGHDVHVAYVHGGPNREPLRSGGVVLHGLRAAGNHDPRLMAQLAKLTARLEPHIVHTWFVQMDVLGGIAAMLTRRPWVVAERSSAHAYPGTIKDRLRKAMATRADAVISNSEGGDAYWEPLIDGGRRFIVRNGLPLDEIESTAPCGLPGPKPGPGQKLALYLGRFDRGKNIENLVGGLAPVIAESGAVAVIGGDGPGRAAICRLVERLGLSDRVQLPGFVPNPWALMKRADVFVSVSEFEGFPNVVIEAMACGCPLVVSDIPAHREFLDERSALLVDPGDPAAIAAAVRETIAKPRDARLRAEAARERAAHWSVAEMARGYDRIYRSVAGSRRVGARAEGR